MPYTIVEEEAGLLVSFTGFSVPYEFQEVAEAMAAHPDRMRHLYHFFDFTRIDSDSLFAITTRIGETHAVRSREIFGESEYPKYTALISPSGKMQTVFETFIAGGPRPAGHEIKSFSTLMQARTWLRDRLDSPGGPAG